ncbi:MAG: hypothetical protein K9J37_03715 [Saprospiraceae bacterium]|nr:hypothetical protein [Saprospiraceae bacterium]MCF8248991.1 hypothetical protein [Saprospiraceae bacterium]MCF8279202.1 hypothetical protein [Bacteroidales bacterium]MCF8310885.1 hypothetical protein [Saprospiraceae bacterium]MCF8439527.1 hypothetical protein [Saprospiraceae bacterium]
MATIFLTVTDLEFLAGQAIKFILLSLLCFGGGLNLYLTKKENGVKRKAVRVAIAVLLFSLTVPLFRWIQIEGSLLQSDDYVIGTTVGLCQVFAKGKGIEFKYEVDGKQFQNCNTYHPVPIGSIVVTDGKYYVRISKKYPEKGRIDFSKPIQ